MELKNPETLANQNQQASVHSCYHYFAPRARLLAGEGEGDELHGQREEHDAQALRGKEREREERGGKEGAGETYAASDGGVIAVLPRTGSRDDKGPQRRVSPAAARQAGRKHRPGKSRSGGAEQR